MSSKSGADGLKTENSIGTVVLLKEKGLSCTQWPLGKVEKIHPNGDGAVRTITMKTATGTFKRAVKCLCPLPIEQ